MIRRLRWKFTLINLLFVGLVLVVVFAVLVASNARRLADQSNTAMRLALSWRDDEAPPRFEVGAPPRWTWPRMVTLVSRAVASLIFLATP